MAVGMAVMVGVELRRADLDWREGRAKEGGRDGRRGGRDGRRGGRGRAIDERKTF